MDANIRCFTVYVLSLKITKTQLQKQQFDRSNLVILVDLTLCCLDSVYVDHLRLYLCYRNKLYTILKLSLSLIHW